jgi:hypothetical protein
VVATEVSKASVAAARHNIAANGVANVFLARMSSEEFVETWRVKGSRFRLTGLDWDALQLNTLLVDPPRCVRWRLLVAGVCVGMGWRHTQRMWWHPHPQMPTTRCVCRPAAQRWAGP